MMRSKSSPNTTRSLFGADTGGDFKLYRSVLSETRDQAREA